MGRYVPDAVDGEERATFIEISVSVTKLSLHGIRTISRYIALLLNPLRPATGTTAAGRPGADRFEYNF
jgi:hypothetical protein